MIRNKTHKKTVDKIQQGFWSLLNEAKKENQELKNKLAITNAVEVDNLIRENTRLREERDELRAFKRSIPIIRHIKQPNGKWKCLECGLERDNENV